MTIARETKELTMADLVAGLRAAMDYDLAHPAQSSRKFGYKIMTGLMQSAKDALDLVADDDWPGLINWYHRWQNNLVNSHGKEAHIAGHRLMCAIYGGSRYSLVNGVFSESFCERYERLVD
jgi:hypothetical protein